MDLCLDIDKEILYSKKEYVMFEGGNNSVVVYNTNKPFEEGHSHFRSKRRARDVIDSCLNKTFPLHWGTYFIESSIRLSTDERYIKKLKQLKRTRDKRYKNY